MFFTIALPVYNEGVSIEPILKNVLDYMKKFLNENKIQYEVLVVNDGSQDETSNILNKLSKSYPILRIFTHEQNRGYRAAVESCLKQAKGDFILVMDSDGQYSIDDAPKFFEKCQSGYDLVLGNKIKRNDPYLRVLLGRGYNWLFGVFFGIKLNEVDCGYRLISKKFSEKLKFGDGNHPIGAKIAVTAKKYGYKISEVPVKHHERAGRKTVFPMSKLPKIVIQSFMELIKLKMKKF